MHWKFPLLFLVLAIGISSGVPGEAAEWETHTIAHLTLELPEGWFRVFGERPGAPGGFIRPLWEGEPPEGEQIFQSADILVVLSGEYAAGPIEELKQSGTPFTEEPITIGGVTTSLYRAEFMGKEAFMVFLEDVQLGFGLFLEKGSPEARRILESITIGAFPYPLRRLLGQEVLDSPQGVACDLEGRVYEPEGPMALLHFYDPKNPERPYLTDQQFLVRLIRFLGGTTFDNPQRDAVTWTFRTRPEDTIEFLGLFDQEYGWIQAKEYLKKAIESKNPGDFYGKAWRAVGEVMHMVADMTVPAHVRNDGHAAVLGDSDPYERGTSGDHLHEALERGRPANLRYFRFDAEALMRDVASYTNANFFSQDTIPERYVSLSLERLEDGRDGYLYSTTDGHRYRALARGGFLDRWWRRCRYAIDRRVVQDQQSILLPTAVRACAGVLYAFLPRFDVKASVAPVSGKEGVFRVVGEITHRPNFQWQEGLRIRNGVFVVIERGKEKTRIPVRNFLGQDLNSFSVEVEAKEDDTISVEYDCGEYVIRSPQEDPSGTYRGKCSLLTPTSSGWAFGITEFPSPSSSPRTERPP